MLNNTAPENPSTSTATIDGRAKRELPTDGRPIRKMIRIPTEEENDAALQDFFLKAKQIRVERREAALKAIEVFPRLAEVMRNKSGQAYKLRALLYSAWNGQATSLSEILCFDWEVRKDLLTVLAGFGWEDKEVSFFYRGIEDQLRAAGLFDWFLEEHKEGVCQS